MLEMVLELVAWEKLNLKKSQLKTCEEEVCARIYLHAGVFGRSTH